MKQQAQTLQYKIWFFPEPKNLGNPNSLRPENSGLWQLWKPGFWIKNRAVKLYFLLIQLKISFFHITLTLDTNATNHTTIGNSDTADLKQTLTKYSTSILQRTVKWCFLNVNSKSELSKADLEKNTPAFNFLADTFVYCGQRPAACTMCPMNKEGKCLSEKKQRFCLPGAMPAAHLVTGAQLREHITPISRQLHGCQCDSVLLAIQSAEWGVSAIPTGWLPAYRYCQPPTTVKCRYMRGLQNSR